MTKQLSLEEFVATRKFCYDGKKSDDLDVRENVEDMGGDGPVPCFLYDGSLIIIVTTSKMRSKHYAETDRIATVPGADKSFYLFLENQQYESDDLAELEAILHEWYLLANWG
jgi:hypothetical protein